MVPAFLRAGLRGLSFGYTVAVTLRNWLFDWGWKKSFPPGVPVVSVGNLTTGGTGKTPMVAFLANWFQDQNIKPAILSRGYHSLDGQANDEKLVLDQLCPGILHLQNPNRVASAKTAIQEHQSQVLVLDDGFQHRRLKRDLDLVLIDATCPFGYEAILPRGLLREPRSSLKRADFVIITRADQVEDEQREQIRSTIRKYHPTVPIGEVAFAPTRLVNAHGETCDFSALKNQPATAFCGIGNPMAFRQTLGLCGVTVEDAGFQTFADHHHYTAKELETLGQLAKDRNATAVLTTQKDLVKISRTHLQDVPLWAVEIGPDWQTGEDLLTARLQELIDRRVCPDGSLDYTDPI